MSTKKITYAIPAYKCRLIRDSSISMEERPYVTQPASIAEIVYSYLGEAPQEHAVLVFLSNQMKVVGIHTVHVGKASECSIELASIFRAVLLAGVTNFAMAHNHPSGNVTPSPEDVRLTEIVVQAAKLLDLNLVDHVIIGEAGRYTSLRERGLAGL